MTQKEKDFAGLSAEEINQQVEKDIKEAGSQWKAKHQHGRGKGVYPWNAATRTAATYLREHRQLYFTEDKQALRDKHESWMDLLEQWFFAAAQ